jgi:protein gp37
MNKSSIEWTNYTSNPLQYRNADGNVVWGCIHASPGCSHCYSEALAKRYGRGGKFDTSTMEGLTPFISEKEIHSILTYKPVSRKMCFLGDMTDIFGEWVPFESIDKIFAAMALRPDVTFQILTKRANRMRRYIIGASPDERDDIQMHMGDLSGEGMDFFETGHGGIPTPKWPLPNVHLGVSVENQQYADERIPLLLQTPAAKRFISYEPALGSVNPERLRPEGMTWMDCLNGRGHAGPGTWGGEPKLDWVIVGGESGPGARPFNIQWARDVVKQCKAADVAVFVKQLGSKPYRICESCGPEFPSQCRMYGRDGHDHSRQLPLYLKDRKGGDMSEWPEYLRVREFPK